MKIKTQILSAVMMGVLSVSQGAGAYATEGLVEPVDEVPGTITIDKIDLGANTLSVTYNDTGTDVDKVLKFTVAYINDGREMGEGDWDEVTYPRWMTRLYDKSIYDDNSAQFLSGQQEVINQSQYYIDWLELGIISPGVLYYGAEVALAGNDDVVRYIMGSADYRGCLAKYKEMDGMAMIECKPETKPSGKVIYAPYMGGVRLQMDEQYEQDDEPDPVDSEPTPDPEPDPEPEPDPDPTPDPEPTPDLDPTSESDPESGPEPETNPDSTLDSRAENSNTTSESSIENVNVVADAFTSGETNSDTATEVSYAVADSFGFLPTGDMEIASEDDNTAEESQPEITVKGEGATNSNGSEVELPDLGGGKEQSSNNLIWWAIAPLLIGGVGVSLWWILLHLKQGRGQKSANN